MKRETIENLLIGLASFAFLTASCLLGAGCSTPEEQAQDEAFDRFIQAIGSHEPCIVFPGGDGLPLGHNFVFSGLNYTGKCADLRGTTNSEEYATAWMGWPIDGTSMNDAVLSAKLSPRFMGGQILATFCKHVQCGGNFEFQQILGFAGQKLFIPNLSSVGGVSHIRLQTF